MEISYEDCVSLLEQANFQEKEVRNKRRWLIGLPSSLNEAEKEERSNFHISRRPIPEDLLREDDVSYEIIKSFVEKKFGLCYFTSNYSTTLDDMQLISLPRDATKFIPLIDNMTNQGLEHFADIMTGGTITFEKTRWKMKQIIKERLSNVLLSTGQLNTSEIQFSILKNPRNFRWGIESRFIPDPGSYHVAVHNILNILDDLPTQILTAMHRKLKGNKGYVPQLIPKRTGWGRNTLIKRLRKACSKLLTKVNEDSLPEPLAKSMEVAALYMKLIQGYRHVTNFRQVSLEVNALQREIATSIQLIDQSLKLSVLKSIQALLDSKKKLSERSLRASVRNLLIEYLIECGDMDTVPQCLRDILSIIRRSFKSSKASNIMSSTETKIKEDVNCILNVSACLKQVLWDLIPEHDLDLDLEFADAYMEDLVDDDDDYFDVDESNENYIPKSDISDEKLAIAEDNFNCIEHLTEFRLSNFSEVKNLQCTNSMGYQMVSLKTTEETKPGFVHDTGNEDGVLNSSSDISESSLMFGDQSMCKNPYLAVQGASDEVSMVAYNLIGRMLSDFVQKEGCEVDPGDLSYLGVGSYELKQKKRKAARKKSATYKEDQCLVSDKKT